MYYLNRDNAYVIKNLTTTILYSRRQNRSARLNMTQMVLQGDTVSPFKLEIHVTDLHKSAIKHMDVIKGICRYLKSL